MSLISNYFIKSDNVSLDDVLQILNLHEDHATYVIVAWKQQELKTSMMSFVHLTVRKKLRTFEKCLPQDVIFEIEKVTSATTLIHQCKVFGETLYDGTTTPPPLHGYQERGHYTPQGKHTAIKSDPTTDKEYVNKLS